MINPRVKCVIRAAIVAAIGGLVMIKHRGAGRMFLVFSGVILVAGMAVPKALERFAVWIERSAARVLSWALMAPFCLVVFIPARLILLLKRRDPLERRFPCPSDTCWSDCRESSDPGRFRRQF